MSIGIFLLAILSPLLYAATNHIDNILLGKYFREGGVGTLLLFSSLLSVLALPVLLVVEPHVIPSDTWTIPVLFFIGVIDVFLLWCYLLAMENDEPTVVIIYYSLVPVTGLVLGYLVLGETITGTQSWAMGTIILGAIILTVATDVDGRIKLRLKTAVYMILASLCWALESTLFKLVALEENVWRSLFWEHLALVAIGVLLFTLVPKYRLSFKTALRVNSKPILGLNVMNEVLYMLGNTVAAYVVILIPVSISLLMNSFQPLFVMALGLVLKFSLSNLDVEHVNGRNLVQKALAIVLTGIGIFLLGE